MYEQFVDTNTISTFSLALNIAVGISREYVTSTISWKWKPKEKEFIA